MAQATIGISAAQVTASTSTAAFRLGTVGGYDDPTLVYGCANGVITGAGYGVVEQTGFDFIMATTTTTAPGASGYGTRFGAAQAALADNEFGWFQIYGKGSIRTLASAAKGTRLNSTATGGALDDDGTASSEAITGITILTATGGSAATNADAVFSYPSVAETL